MVFEKMNSGNQRSFLETAARRIIGTTTACPTKLEQVWLLALREDGRLHNVIAYVLFKGHRMRLNRCQKTLVKSRAIAPLLVSVHHFPESTAKTEQVRIATAFNKRLQKYLGVTLDEQFVVMWDGERAVWRSLAKPNS